MLEKLEHLHMCERVKCVSHYQVEGPKDTSQFGTKLYSGSHSFLGLLSMLLFLKEHFNCSSTQRL